MDLTQIQDELITRLHAGEPLDRSAVLAAHPQHSDALRRFFELIGLIEEPPPSAAPTTLGEFEILRELGRGGMGVVYEANQPSLDRRVALKILPPGLAADPRVLARFKREAEAAGRLRHPNIVPVFSVGEAMGTPFFAMELIEGRSLATVIRLRRAGSDSDGPAAGTEWRRWVVERIAQIAEALAYAHDRGILHRDVKPGNIIIDPTGAPRLTDFGLALDTWKRGLTLAGEQFGTPEYMSPEQLMRHSHPIDERSDCYSLGVTMYELLTLRLPYDAGSAPELVNAVEAGRIVRPRVANPAIEPALAAVLDRALRKNPDERYANLTQFAAELGKLLERWPDPAPPPPPLTRRQAGLAGGMLLLAIAATWWFGFRTPDASASATVPPGAGLGGLAAGDWDGDGQLDFAGTFRLERGKTKLDGVRIRYGRGAAIDLATPSLEPEAITAVDFDADGLLDLVVRGANGPRLYYNGEKFIAHDVLPLSYIDLDLRDGVLGHEAGGNPEQWHPVRCSAVAVGQLGAGDALDLVFATHARNDRRRGGGGIHCIFGNGDRGFLGGVGLHLFKSSKRADVDLALAEFDGDAFADVVVADPQSGPYDPDPGMLIMNINDPSKPPQVGHAPDKSDHRNFELKIVPQSIAGARPMKVIAADLDGDGANDLALLNESAAAVRILTRKRVGDRLAFMQYDNPGLGILDSMVVGVPAFTPKTVALDSIASEFTLHDVDKDGIADIVVLLADARKVQILKGDADGEFRALPPLRVPARQGSRLSGVAVLIRDGRVDVVVGDLGSSRNDVGRIHRLRVPQ